MWLGYYVVSQVLQATMRPSCRIRCMTRSIDSASAPCTYFSLITALCLWWSKNASLADHRNRIPHRNRSTRHFHKSATLHSMYSMQKLTTTTIIYWQRVCLMSYNISMRCSSLSESEAYAMFRTFHASNRSLLP
jgi:hypothetical protein